MQGAQVRCLVGELRSYGVAEKKNNNSLKCLPSWWVPTSPQLPKCSFIQNNKKDPQLKGNCTVKQLFRVLQLLSLTPKLKVWVKTLVHEGAMRWTGMAPTSPFLWSSLILIAISKHLWSSTAQIFVTFSGLYLDSSSFFLFFFLAGCEQAYGEGESQWGKH